MVKKANPSQKEWYICGKIITGKEKIIASANRCFQAFLDFKTRTPVKKADVYEEDVRRARLEISKGELLPNFDNIEISKEDLDVMASSYRQYYSMDYFQAYISTKNPILKLFFSHVISLRPLISRFKQHAIKNKDYSKRSESLKIIKELENALENTDPLLKQIENKVKNADKQNLFDIIKKLKKE